MLKRVGGSKQPAQEVYRNCAKEFCSWDDYSTDSPPPLSLSEDNDRVSLLDPRDPPLSCVPSSFGYSRDQASRLFPYVGYPSCQNKTHTHTAIMDIDQSRETLHMNCSGGKGWYYLGNSWDEERLGYEDYKPQLRKYTKEVRTEGAEWAYGTCSDSPGVKPEGAVYRLRPRKEVRQRVETDMKKLQKGAQYQHGETETRPLTVLMIVLDSLSRKHFYRKLNHTVAFLNRLDPNLTRVFDFKIHNVMGDNSLPNLYPVWSGRSLQPLSEAAKAFHSKQDTDLLEEYSIWSYLRSRGFATMFLAEFCDDYFAQGIGQRPQVDHLSQRFWCAAESLSGYK